MWNGDVIGNDLPPLPLPLEKGEGEEDDVNGGTTPPLSCKDSATGPHGVAESYFLIPRRSRGDPSISTEVRRFTRSPRLRLEMRIS